MAMILGLRKKRRGVQASQEPEFSQDVDLSIKQRAATIAELDLWFAFFLRSLI
jgi:hypothetical protein